MVESTKDDGIYSVREVNEARMVARNFLKQGLSKVDHINSGQTISSISAFFDSKTYASAQGSSETSAFLGDIVDYLKLATTGKDSARLALGYITAKSVPERDYELPKTKEWEELFKQVARMQPPIDTTLNKGLTPNKVLLAGF